MSASITDRPMIRSGVGFLAAAGVALVAVVSPPAARFDAPVTAGAASDWDADLLGLEFPVFPDVVTDAVTATSPIGAAIEAAYLAVEPWVQYGVNVTSWAVGWVPFVGLLAPQINFFYTLGESVVQSGLFNTIDVLDGSISLGTGLSNFAADTTAAFDTFIQTQVDWIRHFFPPLPPLAADTDLLDATTDLTPAVDGLGAFDVGGALPDLNGLSDLGLIS